MFWAEEKQPQFMLKLQREFQNILTFECHFYVYKDVAIKTSTEQKRYVKLSPALWSPKCKQ